MNQIQLLYRTGPLAQALGAEFAEAGRTGRAHAAGLGRLRFR
ncbi:hypothetical protein [Pseudomonas vanderleydeniana]|nr:hypothetical protein [Pseudomonas vanderleydeniana]